MTEFKNTEFTAKNRWLFISVLIISFFLRLISLDKFETWQDERLSVREAKGLENFEITIGQHFTKNELLVHNTITNVIASNIKGDGGNGIVYVLTLHYWTSIFGNTDFSVRFLSLILGVCLVALVFYLSCLIFSNISLALCCMLLAAIHPQLISYSQEARPYALALVFSFSATVIFYRMLKSSEFKIKLLGLYTILLVASFLTHYSSIYIFVAHFIALLFIYKTNFKIWLRLTLFAGLAFTLIYTWFYFYGFAGLEIISERNHNYKLLSIADPTNSFYMKTSFYSVFAGWAQNLLSFCGITIVNLGWRILFVLPLLIFPLIVLIQGIKKVTQEHNKAVVFLVLLTLSSLVYATLLSLAAGHIISFQQLYSIFSTPYFIILLGASVFYLMTEHPRSMINMVLVAVQILLMLFSVTLIYLGYDSNSKKQNKYEKLALQIETVFEREQKHFTIVYSQKIDAIEVNKYLKASVKGIPQIVGEHTAPKLYLIFSQTDEKVVLWQ